MLTFRGIRARADEAGIVRFTESRYDDYAAAVGASSEVVVHEGGPPFRWGAPSGGARSLCEAVIFHTLMTMRHMTVSRARAFGQSYASALMWAWAVGLQANEWTATADEIAIALDSIGFNHPGLERPAKLEIPLELLQSCRDEINAWLTHTPEEERGEGCRKTVELLERLDSLLQGREPRRLTTNDAVSPVAGVVITTAGPEAA